MRVTVFGATGGIGRQVADRLVRAGHEVNAFVRESRAALPPGVTTTVGDLGDADSVTRAVTGSDAVIWAVGATANRPDQVATFETGARNVVAAMQRTGARRLVALSGAGITVDGERKPLAGRLMSAFVALAVRHVVEAKRREYLVFRDADLDWTLVRPPRVVEGEATGRVRAGPALAGRSVTRGDLAEFMVAQLTDRTYVRQAPYVSS